MKKSSNDLQSLMVIINQLEDELKDSLIKKYSKKNNN